MARIGIIQQGRNHSIEEIQKLSTNTPRYAIFYWVMEIITFIISVDCFGVYHKGRYLSWGAIFISLFILMWFINLGGTLLQLSILKILEKKELLVPYIEKFRAEKPIITVISKSYHNVRFRTINTHTEENYLFISEWSDVSPPLDIKSSNFCAKVHFKCELEMDEESSKIVDKIIENMTLRNQHRDELFSVEVITTINGLKWKKSFCTNENNNPWYAKRIWLVLSNFLLCPVLFIIKINQLLLLSRYDFIKKVKITGTQTPLPIIVFYEKTINQVLFIDVHGVHTYPDQLPTEESLNNLPNEEQQGSTSVPLQPMYPDYPPPNNSSN